MRLYSRTTFAVHPIGKIAFENEGKTPEPKNLPSFQVYRRLTF